MHAADAHLLPAQIVNVVRFSPNGTTLASAGDDCNVMLWRERVVRTGAFGEAPRPGIAASSVAWAPACVMRGHCQDVYDLAWSPRGDSLLSGCVDGTVIVWNIAEGKPMQTLRDHENYVQGVAWDPVDEYVVSLSCDRTARIYVNASVSGKKAKKKSKETSGAAKGPCPEQPSSRSYVAHTVLAKRTHSVFQPAKPAAGPRDAATPTLPAAASEATPTEAMPKEATPTEATPAEAAPEEAGSPSNLMRPIDFEQAVEETPASEGVTGPSPPKDAPMLTADTSAKQTKVCTELKDGACCERRAFARFAPRPPAHHPRRHGVRRSLVL